MRTAAAVIRQPTHTVQLTVSRVHTKTLSFYGPLVDSAEVKFDRPERELY